MNERRSSIKIRVENMDYEVVGGEFQQLLTAVKALPQRRFVGHLKLWEVSSSVELVRGQLENSGLFLEGGTPVPETETPPPATFNDRIKIQVPGYQATVTGASFQDMLTIIKAISGRRFDGETKLWSLPGSLTENKTYFEKKGLRLEDLVQVEEQNPPQTAAPQTNATAYQPPSTPAYASSPPPPPPLFDSPPINEPQFDAPPMRTNSGWGAEDEVTFDDFGSGRDYFEGQSQPNIPDPYAQTPPPAPPPPFMPTDSPPPVANKPSFSGRQDKIKVLVGDSPLVITGGTFSEMLAAIKAMPERRFDGESKQWLLPDDINTVQQHIKAKGFRLEET